MTTPRASPEHVKDVINTDASTKVIGGFLEDAAALLAARDTSELDEETLETIETYLAAHFLRLNYEPQKIEASALDATVRYSEKGTGIGLRATGPGQVVLELDTVGLFDPASPGGFVGTATPGTDESSELAEREPEDER